MEIIILILLCVIGSMGTYIYLESLKNIPIMDIVHSHMEEEGIKEADVEVEIIVRFENVQR